MTFFNKFQLAFKRIQTHGFHSDEISNPAFVARQVGPADPQAFRDAFQGSWYVELEPKTGTGKPRRGVLRMELPNHLIAVSGDLYQWPSSASGKSPPGLETDGGRWYPQSPTESYFAYFRSRQVVFQNGTLRIDLLPKKWDGNEKDFLEPPATDDSTMSLRVMPDPQKDPKTGRETVALTGDCDFLGVAYSATLFKTSEYFRGLRLDVEVMAGLYESTEDWPRQVESCVQNSILQLTEICRGQGLDIKLGQAVEGRQEDPITPLALHNRLTTHRGKKAQSPGQWRLWMLIAANGNGNLDDVYGAMFDLRGAQREGIVVFFSKKIDGNTRVPGEIGKDALAFLRTIIHEIGHALNLDHTTLITNGNDHSKETLMNPTETVKDQSSEHRKFPCNAEFAFTRVEKSTLIYASDPEIRPGWQPFNWLKIARRLEFIPRGDHGRHFPNPKIVRERSLANPSHVERPKFSLTTLSGSNQLAQDHLVAIRITIPHALADRVGAGLDLAHDDLRLFLLEKDEPRRQLRDVLHLCRDPRWVAIRPGEDFSAVMQLTYTNQGLVFREPGSFRLMAELALPPGQGPPLESDVLHIEIQPAPTERQDFVRRMNDPKMAQTFAFAGFDPEDSNLIEELWTARDLAIDPHTRAAINLVLYNSLAPRGELSQNAEADSERENLYRETLERSLDEDGMASGDLFELATAIASPFEPFPPMLKILDQKEAERVQRVAQIEGGENKLQRVRNQYYRRTGISPGP